jgi:hypothetical protein
LAKAVNSRTGKNISPRLIQQFESVEQKREEDLEKVRLKNISLRTTLRKLDRALRAKEQLAEGLHMIDFEQLKIENQTLNEKIEERNEELAKLKRKKTVTVQVLAGLLVWWIGALGAGGLGVCRVFVEKCSIELDLGFDAHSREAAVC